MDIKNGEWICLCALFETIFIRIFINYIFLNQKIHFFLFVIMNFIRIPTKDLFICSSLTILIFLNEILNLKIDTGCILCDYCASLLSLNYRKCMEFFEQISFDKRNACKRLSSVFKSIADHAERLQQNTQSGLC